MGATQRELLEERWKVLMLDTEQFADEWASRRSTASGGGA
jgi:hypothetical protein